MSTAHTPPPKDPKPKGRDGEKAIERPPADKMVKRPPIAK